MDVNDYFIDIESENIDNGNIDNSIDNIIMLNNSKYDNNNDINENDKKCQFLYKLPPLVIIDKILPFLQKRIYLGHMAMTCTYLCDLLYSKHAFNVWNKNLPPVYICIDSYCPLCPYKRIQSIDNSAAFNLLRDIPIESLVIHCFITDIPSCLESLATLGCLSNLEVKLTNKSNSPSLEELLKNINFPVTAYSTERKKDIFPFLKNLILDSSNLNHVNLKGRSRLLDILGTNLETLSFRGLSPAGIFSVLGKLCKKLKKLRVDKATSFVDLLAYQNEDLEHLEILRCNFVLNSFLPFPKLKTLIYSPAMRCEENQIEGVVFSLPISLIHISLEIPSEMVNSLLNAISKKLKIIEKINIQAAFGTGLVESSSLKVLGNNCISLKEFEIVSTKSVNSITFDSSAFKAFGSFLACECITVMYENNVIDDLVDTLKRSLSLKTLKLWQRHKWIPTAEWIGMEKTIQHINAQFPHVNIILEKI